MRAQQPPSAATTGSSRSTRCKPQEQLPAAPLVMGAYAVAWVAVFGYLWSIWRRLGRVERELAEVSRRVPAGGGAALNFANMTSAHFIFIPAVLLIGIVIGWILGLARRAGRVRGGAEETGRAGEAEGRTLAREATELPRLESTVS